MNMHKKYESWVLNQKQPPAIDDFKICWDWKFFKFWGSWIIAWPEVMLRRLDIGPLVFTWTYARKKES